MSSPIETESTAHPSRPDVRCPFCGVSDAERIAFFGSQLLTEQWYCRACRTPFERVKDSVEDAVGNERAAPPR